MESSYPRGTGTSGISSQDYNTSRGVKSSQDCIEVRGKPWRHLLHSIGALFGSCCCFGYGVFVPLLHGNGNPKAQSAAKAFSLSFFHWLQQLAMGLQQQSRWADKTVSCQQQHQ